MPHLPQTVTTVTPAWDLPAINETLALATPETIVRWALAQGVRQLTSTSFGPHAAATLHLVHSLDPNSQTVWVDTGFAGESTREFARRLTNQLHLELAVYRPQIPPMTCLEQLGIRDLSAINSQQRQRLADITKIEPFQRAVTDLAPQIWISGIRAEETAFRAGLDVASWDPRGILKLSPFLRASAADMDHYLQQHGLPKGPSVFDPTKAEAHLECGLHTRNGQVQGQNRVMAPQL